MDFELVNGDLKPETLKQLVIEECKNFKSNYDYMEDNINPKGNPTLWRYMDFTKFLSLIDSEKLFFSKPKYFEDPYEGTFSFQDIKEDVYPASSELWQDGYTLKKLSANILDNAAVMCWHMNEYESAAMWGLYLSSNEGIAIKTSYKRLLQSIKDRKWYIFSGEIQYVDYSKDKVATYILETLFYKRHSFNHEKEFRLIVIADPLEDDENNINSHLENIETDEGYEQIPVCGQTKFDFDFGANIECDLKELIEEIYISPSAPGWFGDLVNSVLEKYGLENVKITHSALNSHDLY